jgi:hypothetical protein
LALAAKANLELFSISIIYFFKQRQVLIPHPQQTTQVVTIGYDISKSISEYQSQPTSPALKLKNGLFFERVRDVLKKLREK